jgi:DNA ligase D-like protein (predicted 3'-phosphoesterase)
MGSLQQSWKRAIVQGVLRRMLGEAGQAPGLRHRPTLAGTTKAMGALDDYESKRDFSQSPEPRGGGTGPRDRGRPRFVIQEHAASSLHYDFRLEVDGVLKSWAVPKGLSTDPREKRLAVQVEDHPLDYADFEGVIESGYGAGRVIVWDNGTWESLTGGPVEEALQRGHLSVWLEGEKLRGGWTLQRTRDGAKPQWLLIKRRDEGADARRNPVSTQPESVLSGRTVDDVSD